MTARRARWLAVLVVLIWLGLGGVGGPLVGKLSEVQKNDNASFLPASAESTEVNRWIERAQPVRTLPYFVVLERDTPFTPAELGTVQQWAQQLPTATFPADRSRTLAELLESTPRGAVPSQDGKALLVVVSLDSTKSADTRIGGKTALAQSAETLRTATASIGSQLGAAAHLSGPGGFLADFVVAFGGIDGILLAVALGVVFVILLGVYRSPILPVVVLLSAIFGLAAAALAVYPLAKNGTIALSGQSQGILSILVVGAATDYALLLVARFREELHDTDSAWEAMRRAWRAAVEPIVASAATVILGLLCLRLSELNSTAGLGPVGAFGIAGALVASLTFLPAVLLAIGRRVFWPVAPKVDHVHDVDKLERSRIWGRVARLVGSHPRAVWVTTFAALLVGAAFLPTFKASGVEQNDLFLTRVDSVVGQEAIARHFPAGSGTPVIVLAPSAKAAAALEVVKAQPGLRDATAGLTPGRPSVELDGKVAITATSVDAPDGLAAEEVVSRLRAALDPVGTDVLVGGNTAINYDVRTASERDLRVVIPAILAVVFVVLVLLLRSLVAPIILVVANVLSFACTLGTAAILFNHVWKFPGSDPATPLYGFVFLVALGIDYSIFLMTRVREESRRQGTRRGVLVGLAVTGGVITSAGIVLAATFGALAVLPILFLVQIAFIVAYGVLLDTLVVRSLLVPAIAYDIGRRTWWPSRLARQDGAERRSPAASQDADSRTTT
ncbi:MAG TPA: MMPL family transporter [Dermatophilaceae bacterium]|nr:MMPL family transporter [Dermatophilaceae bacterium]